MYPPVDYPLKSRSDDAADSADITYAALLDRYDSEQVITNAMIQRACQKMDEAQQFPFAPISLGASVDATETNGLLGRLKSIVS